MLICVLGKRVYGLRTWGLWILCISRNWLEWVYLINLMNLLVILFYLEFFHANWCFDLECIWSQNLSFVGVFFFFFFFLIVWFYRKFFHVNWFWFRVYIGFRTWGLWVLSICRNWFEWVYLINLLNLLIVWFYLKFFHVNWCFGLESIYGFRTWGFWVLSISRNWVEWVYLITLLNLPIVWFYLKIFHVNWCFGLEGIWFQDLGFAGFEYKQQLV